MARKIARKVATVETVAAVAAVAPRSETLLKAIERIETRRKRKMTEYQIGILEFVIDGEGNAVVNAVAGSGKTTTLEDCANGITYGASRPSILMLAFNKSIANELTARMPQNATCKTLNGLGHSILAKGLNRQLTPDTEKTTILAKKVAGFDEMNPDDSARFFSVLPAIKRLVSLFKGFGFGAIAPLPDVDGISAVCDEYDIDIDEEIDMEWFVDLLMRTYEECITNTRIIDFDDQLFMPIAMNMPFPSYYKFTFVDESQDLNAIQTEMVRRIKGRKIFVGDRNQSIYGFRGANPESIDNIVAEFSATELPLSTTWRCPVAVVEKAKEIVPHIEAAPNAKQGKVEYIDECELNDKIEDGDFIICRTNAPLMDMCMGFIREGRKAVIMGRDIGERLNSMINKISKRKYAGTFWDQIKQYKDVEIEKLNKPGQESKVQKLSDQLDTLLVLAESCETKAEAQKKIQNIFSDTAKGIVLMTAHKSKGLEPSKDANVFIVHPELMPHPMAKKPRDRKQEQNLLYVAMTRATNGLYFVQPKNPIRFGR